MVFRGLGDKEPDAITIERLEERFGEPETEVEVEGMTETPGEILGDKSGVGTGDGGDGVPSEADTMLLEFSFVGWSCEELPRSAETACKRAALMASELSAVDTTGKVEFGGWYGELLWEQEGVEDDRVDARLDWSDSEFVLSCCESVFDSRLTEINGLSKRGAAL